MVKKIELSKPPVIEVVIGSQFDGPIFDNSYVYEFFQKIKDQYPIEKMCKVFEVSRSGFYKWRKRMNTESERHPLDQLIIECQEQTKQTYGYRRTALWIQKQGKGNWCPLTVLHHMRKLELLAQVRRKRAYTTYKQGGHKYENLLNREFVQEKPNYRWVTDITYIITPQRTYYLCAILDLHSRYIVAYRLGTEITASLVADTVRDAFAREKGKVADGLALHSDQGCQYTSEEYFALTQEYHFAASMSRRGCPYDNAIMENFFGTFKTECLYRCRPTTGEQVRQLVDEYIHFYNYERIDLKNGLTPYEIRSKTA